MYVRVISAAAVIALVGFVNGSETNDECQDISGNVDQWLVESGRDMRRSGADSVAVAGFKRDIPVSIFGFDVPFLNVHLEVSKGSLKSMDKLTRASVIKKCRSSPTRTVTSGDFLYENVSIEFNYMKANFLFWQTEGEFKYKFFPKLYLALEWNSTCSLVAPLILQNSGDSDYNINTGSSLKSWILDKILHGALLAGGDNTPMLMDFMELASEDIKTYFGHYCCREMEM